MKGTSMKQKLLVLLGAGSSLSQGMPKVSDIDQLMLQWFSLNDGNASFVTASIQAFKNLPHQSMSYWLPQSLLSDFVLGETLEMYGGKPARGMSSGNTSFACRLLWEVPPRLIGGRKKWNPGECRWRQSSLLSFSLHGVLLCTRLDADESISRLQFEKHQPVLATRTRMGQEN